MPIEVINKWFIEYDKWVNQAERKKELGLEWTQYDKILDITYHNKHELLLKAEEMSVLHKKEKSRMLELMKRIK